MLEIKPSQRAKLRERCKRGIILGLYRNSHISEKQFERLMKTRTVE